MGDISAEPSMEDILSSIKRIIAEEGDAAVAARSARRSPAPRSAPLPTPRPDAHDFDRDEILELSDPVRAPAAERPAPAPRVEPAEPEEPPAERNEDAASSVDPILSPQAVQATRGPLETLSRMVVKPEVAGADTLEGLVREMLRPMLRDWLDSRLPVLVEQMVAKEIARITGRY